MDIQFYIDVFGFWIDDEKFLIWSSQDDLYYWPLNENYKKLSFVSSCCGVFRLSKSIIAVLDQNTNSIVLINNNAEFVKSIDLLNLRMDEKN